MQQEKETSSTPVPTVDSRDQPRAPFSLMIVRQTPATHCYMMWQYGVLEGLENLREKASDSFALRSRVGRHCR